MKKKPLVVASISGRIYQTNDLKNGLMSDEKVDVTDDVLVATADYFMSNNSHLITHELKYSGGKSYMFHTVDDRKAKKIKSILEEAE